MAVPLIKIYYITPMKTQLYKLVALGLALTFTLSCSGGNNEEVSSSSSYLSSSSVEASSSSSETSSSSSVSVDVSSSSSIEASSSSSETGSSSSEVSSSSSEASSSSSVAEVSSSSSVKAVEIGSQVWMAENLNYAVEGSKCVDGKTLTDENTAYCDTYGRLYNFEAAKKACPSGWHLPSYDEWDTLIKFVGTYSTAGMFLKAKSGWSRGSAAGEDTYGFTALAGGYVDNNEVYDVGTGGYWWGFADNKFNDHVYLYISGNPYHGGDVSLEDSYDGSDEIYFYSVRCLQDLK